MPSIVHVCNLGSPHVERWIQPLQELGYRNHLVGPGSEDDARRWTQDFGVAAADTVRSTLQWIKLARRLSGDDPTAILHAHSCGKPSVVALLTARPFLATVYGSEVLAARSRAAKALTTLVLRRASRVSTTSAPATAAVARLAPRTDVHEFSLGYDDTVFLPGLPGREPVFLSIRRFLPNYRILEVIAGFEKYKESGGSGRLLLLAGHLGAQREYANEVIDRVRISAFAESIEVIDRLLDPTGLAALLDQTSCVVSVPRTDQFSTTLLEAMGSGCSLIVSDLDAYRPISSLAGVATSANVDPVSLCERFLEQERCNGETRAGLVTRAQEIQGSVIPAMQSFYRSS